MSKRKVVLVGSLPPPVGGVTMHLSRFIHRAQQERLDISIIDIKKARSVVEGRECSGFWAALKVFFRSDIVHIHVSNNLKLFLALFAKFCFKKVVYTHHNNLIKEGFLFRLFCLIVDQFIFVNDKCIPESLLNDSKRAGWSVIPAFIMPPELPKLPEMLAERIRKFDYVFCFNASARAMIDGRDVYGVDLVFDVLSDISIVEYIQNFCFIFLDPSGAYRKQVNEFLEVNPGCSSSFIYVHSPDISYSSLLKNSTVSIRPTRTDGDSLSVRESLALGVPVVASDVVSRPEGAIVFKAGDAADLKEKLLRAVFVEPKTLQKDDFFWPVIELYEQI